MRRVPAIGHARAFTRSSKAQPSCPLRKSAGTSWTLNRSLLPPFNGELEAAMLRRHGWPQTASNRIDLALVDLWASGEALGERAGYLRDSGSLRHE
jgi:hypothetical protein